jgi:beta-glucosidase-like glycosyl hydrolase
MPAIRWRADTGFDHEMAGINRALELGVGGFIIFGGTSDAVNQLTSEMRERAGRHLLVGSDLERGTGQQLEGSPELPPPGALGALPPLRSRPSRTTGVSEPASWARLAGRCTASTALPGINLIFAPVADLDIEPENPIVQSRSFGPDPALVATCVREWIEGCQGAGALACVKHYPGHGRTTRDSHAEVPTVTASAEELKKDEWPFLAAIDAGVGAVMTSHVSYPALDQSGTPATFSKPILQRLRASGFSGLIVTDAMIMEGARREGGEASAAVEIIEAGVDLLLYPRDTEAVVDGLRTGLKTGTLSQERVRDSLRRYHAAVVWTQRPPVNDLVHPAIPAQIADLLLKQGLSRGPLERLRQPLELIVIDDDIGGPYPPSPEVLVPGLLGPRGVQTGPGGSRVILVFAEPRGWKSRAGLSQAAKTALARSAATADLVILFGHPRLVEEIPGAAPVLVAWHRQKLMQDAVVRCLTQQVT